MRATGSATTLSSDSQLALTGHRDGGVNDVFRQQVHSRGKDALEEYSPHRPERPYDRGPISAVICPNGR